MCEELRLTYTFETVRHPQAAETQRAPAKQAVCDYEQTRKPQRVFLRAGVSGRLLASRPNHRDQVEAQRSGTKRRAVVTNRPGGRFSPGLL